MEKPSIWWCVQGFVPDVDLQRAHIQSLGRVSAHWNKFQMDYAKIYFDYIGYFAALYECFGPKSTYGA